MVLTVTSMFLISCVMTDQERQVARVQQQEIDVTEAANRCVAFGFVRNTQAFSNCVQVSYSDMLTQRQAETADRNRRFYNAMAGLQAAGRDLQANSGLQAPAPGSITGRTLNCRPQPHPSQIYCW